MARAKYSHLLTVANDLLHLSDRFGMVHPIGAETDVAGPVTKLHRRIKLARRLPTRTRSQKRSFRPLGRGGRRRLPALVALRLRHKSGSPPASALHWRAPTMPPRNSRTPSRT